MNNKGYLRMHIFSKSINLVAQRAFFAMVTLIASSISASEVPSGMLPETATPTHYELFLNIDPNKADFNGHIVIDVDIAKETDFLYMHGKELTITDAKINGSNVDIIKTDVDGVLKVNFAKKIKAGSYKLSITYNALFNTNLEGIHRIKEGDKHFVFSQMESIYARLGFPSFDEPRFKTTFDLSVEIPADLSVISNTPEKSVKQNGSSKLVTFVTSKPMPTYLFAIAVGDFDVVEWANIPTNDIRNFEVPLRGIAVRGKGEQLAYALEHTAEILYALEDYFQIPYPYKKLDILAVPDFAAGAMENIGAITYRESLLLFDADKASISQKRRYKSVHAHELAHQWFGNLVTPVWWNDIWLNEAFATWISSTALHRHFPDEQWKRGLSRGAQYAMTSDSLPSSRKIRNPIDTNEQISSAFDGITYSKGGGVLSMFEAAIGADAFQQGVHNYLVKYEWKNADAFDFINTISAGVEKEKAKALSGAITDFISQVGVPQLDVAASCEDDVTKLSISQSRYAPLGTEFKEKTLWNIPACINYEVDGKRQNQCTLLGKRSQELTLEAKGCAAYVMPNASAAGYYRFNMNKKGWSELLSNMDKLSPIEANALMDSFGASYLAGHITISDFIEILPSTLESKSWEVNVKGLSNFSQLVNYADDNQKPTLRNMAAKIYSEAASEIGFESNTELDKSAPRDAAQLRVSLLGFMANTVKDESYIKKFSEAAKTYIGYGSDNKLNQNAIDSALIGTALSVAVMNEDINFSKALLKMALASTDDTFHSRAYSALASTENSEVAAYLLPYILDSNIKDNRASTLAFGLLREDKIDDVAWPWLQANFDMLIARLPNNFVKSVPYLFSRDCSKKIVKRMDTFLKPKLASLPGAERNYKKTLETLNQCMARKAHFKPQITELLNSAK